MARGFSVAVRDGESGTLWRLTRTVEPYSWQRFGRLLMGWRELVSRVQEHADFTWIPTVERSNVSVQGETGAIADILRLCLWAGADSRTRWLTSQSDASVALLTGALPNGLTNPHLAELEELTESIEDLALPVNLIDLCRHYQLDGPGIGFSALKEFIASEAAADADRRQSRVSKWAPAIAKLTEGVDDRESRAGGVSLPSRRSRVSRFVEQYVGRHDKLPDGVHVIESVGEIDFGELRRALGE